MSKKDSGSTAFLVLSLTLTVAVVAWILFVLMFVFNKNAPVAQWHERTPHTVRTLVQSQPGDRGVNPHVAWISGGRTARRPLSL